MTSIRHLIAMVLGLALAMSMACEEDITSEPTKFFAEAPFELGFNANARSRFSLQSINGTVKITGDPAVQKIIVTGIRRVGSSSLADAQSHLDSLSVAADSSDSAVFVWTEQPVLSDGRDYVVDYNITLPDGLSVVAAGANGSVVLRALRGGVVVAFANAWIEGATLEGDAEITVANGDIKTTLTLTPGGKAVLEAANGQIHLKIPIDTSAELEASAASGAIAIENLTLTDEVRTPTSVSGTLGGGNGLISVGVANGSILVEGF